MNRHECLRIYGTKFIDWLANYVEHAAQSLVSHRNFDWSAQVDRIHAANHTFGCLHGNATHAPFAEVLLHFENDADGRGYGKTVAGNAQGLIDCRKLRLLKLHVDCWPRDLNDFANILCHKIL